jgi:hypothetical protein
MRGGQAEKAITTLERAGDKARSEHAYGGAAEFYRDLLIWLDQPSRTGERARVQEKLGEVLLIAARYDEAIQVLEDASGSYRAGSDREGEVRTVARLGHTHFRRRSATEKIRRLEPTFSVNTVGHMSREGQARRRSLEDAGPRRFIAGG